MTNLFSEFLSSPNTECLFHGDSYLQDKIGKYSFPNPLNVVKTPKCGVFYEKKIYTNKYDFSKKKKNRLIMKKHFGNVRAH